MTVESIPNFTAPAAKLWATIPAATKKQFLSNVYCGHCRGSTNRGAPLHCWQRKAASINRPESAALVEVLKALRAHPAVAWCERMNSGAAKVGNRFIRFGWPGCPDELGQLKDGRILGVEVKSPTGTLRPEQAVFLDRIRGAGGVAFMARDCRDVFREITELAK